MWPQGVLFLVKLEAAQSSGSLLLTRLCGDFDCIGSLAAISPELGVFPEAISEDLQKLAEESRAHQHLTRPLGWDHQKVRSGGRRLVGMSNRYIQMELLFKGRLVPEPSSMACDFYTANISPGTGPGAPSQWCKKMGFCPSHHLPSHTPFCPLHQSGSESSGHSWALLERGWPPREEGREGDGIFKC